GRGSLQAGERSLGVRLPAPGSVGGFDGVLLLACGTSWHAALIGKFLIEGMARMSVEVDYGSEFGYRSPVVDGRTLTVGVSQSGETADTIAALTEARGAGSPLVATVHVPGRTLARSAVRHAETRA